MKIHEYNEMMAYLMRPASLKESGRTGFAKAGLADPANNVKVGQELGTGINQRQNSPGAIRYTAIHGSTKSMKDKKIRMTNYKTLDEALDRRKKLIEEFGEITYSGEGKKIYTWENFTKDPKFEEFFKTQLDENPSIKKTIEKYNLDKNNLEEIFNKLRKEVKRTEQLKQGLITGEKLADANVLARLGEKFEYTYKPRLGTIDTKEIAKLMDLPEKEVTKFMSQMNETYPSVLERRTKEGINKASAIERANIFKNKLDELGIEYNQTVANPKRKRYGDSAGTGKKIGQWRFTINEDQTKKLKDTPRLFKKQLQPGTIIGTEKVKDIGTKLSKASEEYKKFGYSKDRTAIQELGTAINRSFKSMSYDDLKKYIKKNPKLLNMVELGFNATLGEFDKINIDDLSEAQLRQSVFMEADHIRGRSTIKYDAGTKKILDGIGIEYPRNLYLVPKMINTSVKQKVENWIANHPNETKKIKMLDQKFKDNGMSYWNRNTGAYGGAIPKNTATDLSHLGLDVEELLQNNQSVDKPERLLAKLKQIAQLRGQKIKPGMLEQAVSLLGKGGAKGQAAAAVITGVVGYNFGEDFLKDSNIIDRTYQDTASLGNAPIVEEEFTTGEKAAAAGAASLVIPAARKAAGKILGLATGPTGMGLLTYGFKPEGGYDLSRTGDRLGFEAEAALAPTLVKGVTEVSSKIKNPLLRKGLETLAGVRIPGLMNPANALKIARVANPIGIASLAGEAVYNVGKLGYEDQKRFNALSPEEQAAERAEQEKFASDVEGS